MRTHILMILLTLVVTACSSRRDVASTQDPQHEQDQAQHAQMIDGQASRIR